MSRDRLSIEHPNANVQIGGKGHPQEIGHLQPCGQRVHPTKGQDHPQNQSPQHHEPEESKAEALQIKENDAPEEVEAQLNSKKQKAP